MSKKKLTSVGILFEFLRGAKKFFAIAILAAVGSTGASLLMTRIVGYTVDTLIGQTDVAPSKIVLYVLDFLSGSAGHTLAICALSVLLCTAINGVLTYAMRVSLASGSERLMKTARNRLFSHVQRLPFRWHSDNQTGDIIQRCTSDVETTQKFVSDQLIEVIRTVVTIVATLVMMFLMNTTVALIVTAFLPIILGYTMYFGMRIANEFRRCDEAEGDLMIAVQENLTGVRVVRAFGRERFETDKFDKFNDTLAEKWIALGYTLGAFWAIGDTVAVLAMMASLIFGGMIAANGNITLGDFVVLTTLTGNIVWPVRQMGRTLSEMSKAGVSLSRLREILEVEPESTLPDAKKPPMNGDIVFENVSFSHGDNDVLREVSLTCPGGGTLGVLGATGSGKSTLAFLLTRLFDISEGGGRITVGGVDVREIDTEYLRRNVGLVLQEPFLFSKTISENIDIAVNTGELERIREAARIASVDDDIVEFEHGYDTVVGERGVTLSGGQKQRVAIARTLMSGSPIMIFDDSMSSLDMETDAKIRKALRSSTSGATVIIISHRISTLMNADSIVVLDEGRVVESGSHRELLAHDGTYRRIYDIQSSGGDE